MKILCWSVLIGTLLMLGCKKEQANTNSGYVCSNGNCIISSNPQFITYADCQTGCSSGSGGTGGYKCSSGSCQAVSANAQYSTYSSCYNSCGSHPQYGSIQVLGYPSCPISGANAPFVSFTLSGTINANFQLHAGEKYTNNNVLAGTVNYHATETCTSNVKNGNAQIVAGQTTYITVNF